MGVGLTESMKLGIEYYEDLNKRMPRSEVAEIFKYGECSFRALEVPFFGF